MTPISDLCALVDHAALRGVRKLSVQQDETLIEIALWPSAEQGNSPAALEDQDTIVTACGPGIFHCAHPVGTEKIPCLEAGDFLFPVSDALTKADEVLVQNGTVVGFGTPLMRRPLQT